MITNSLPYLAVDSRSHCIFDLIGNTTDALKAKYKGDAAGRYVTRDLLVNKGVVDIFSPGSHGRFTAKAELMAYFGAHDDLVVDGEDAAVPITNRIGGTITEFKDGGTGTDLGFEITLERTENGIDRSDIGDMAVATATFGNNDTDEMDGTWTANFYGAPADPDVAREMNNNKLPSGVAGEFNVGSDEGYTRVVGAYAAEK